MRKSLSLVFLTLANKIKLNKNIKSTHKYGKLAILLAIAVINTGCLIEDVVQPTQVGAGSTFTTTVTVSRGDAESNAHYGAMAVMVPDDWTYTSGSFTTTDDIGSGEMLVDPDNGSVWLTQADGYGSLPVDINTFFTTPDNMQWVCLLSDQGSLTDAGVVHEVTLNFGVGNTNGSYPIGYVVTVNSGNMMDWINADDVEDNYAGVDTSFNHMVEVVTTSADVLINEFDTHTSSSEYIELFNTTAADIDLAASAYSLVFYNGNGDSEYQTTDLTGTIPANGFFVLAESAASDLYGYIPDQNASWTSFQNGVDAVALVSSGTQVDAIIYGSSADTGLEALLGLSGILISNGTSGSSSRVTDGQGGASYANDDWHITASRTPGSTNEVAPPTYTPYTIVEIQTPGADGDASQHVDEYVETSGVITAATSYSFYMQDGTVDYSGIYVYNSPGTAILGDNVTVTGTVFEQYGLTQISGVADVIINSTGNDLPTAIVLTTGSLSESHEGMLVTISGECTAISTNAGSDHWAFKLDDGSGDALVDDQLFSDAENTTTLGTAYDVVGVVNYYFSSFTVNPREADDVVEAAVTYSVNFAIDMSGTGYPDADYGSVVINYSPTWNGWGVTLLDEDLDGIYTGTLSGLADGTTAEFVVAVTGAADSWSGWGIQFGAPVMSECDVVQNGTNGNYGFTISGADVNVAYCPGTCEATCPTPAGLVESFEGDFPPYGWTLYNNSNTSNDISQATNYAYDGASSMMFSSYYSAADYTQHAVSPLLDVGGTGGTFSFWYLRNGYSTETFEVGVSNTTDDLGSFTWGPVVSVTINQVWAQHVEDLSGYADEDIYVAIRYMDADNYYYRLHIDMVEGPPIWVDTDPVATMSPDELDLGTVFISSSASGDITVSNNGGGTLTGTIASDNAKFALSDFGGSVEPGESATVTVTYTPTEAMADMGYVILTHNGASSPDSVTVTGTGTLDILVEDFDGVWSGDPLAPEGWTVINSDADNYTWTQSNTYIPEVDGYAAHGMGNQSDMLTSPTVTADGNYLLKWFDVVESGTYGRNTYDVLVSADGGATTDNLGTFDCMNTDLTEHVLSLAAYNGLSVQVSFYQYYSQSNWYGFGIENVSISPAPVVPILSVSPEAVLFMATEVGSTRTTTVAITNTGSGDLSGTVAYSDGFTGPASFSGDSLMVVSYSPTTSGIHSGSITITSNGGDAAVAASGNAGGSVATWDDDADGDGYADWPMGWETINNDGGSQDWEFYGGTHAHSGDGYTRTRYESSSIYNDDWLVSPKLDVVAGDMTTFYAKTYSATGDFMSVMLSTTGGNTVADFDVTLLAATNIATDYTAFSYDLSAYAGTQVRVAIVYGGDYAWYLYVDDVATSAVYQDAGPVIYDYPLSLNFGTGLLGSSDTLLFDYYNTGGGDLLVTAVTFEESSGAFSLSSTSTLPVTTEPGAIGSFNVVFSPAADGPYIDTMIVVHNAGDSLRIPVSGNGLNAIYYEDFAGYYDEWSEGWVFSDDGVHCPTDQGCSNETGDYWRRTAFGSNVDNAFIYHTYNTGTDADTAFAPSAVLAAVADYHYELDFTEYMAFGGDATISAVCISTDGGTTYAILTEADYAGSGWSEHTTVNLTAYDDQTIQLAYVYQATFGNVWAVDNIAIKSVANPIVPIAVVSTPVFPATALGASSSAMLYYSNVGSGNLSATITYPASMSGATEITELAPNLSDSTVVTYTPTAAGQEAEMIVVDGSASGAVPVSVAPEANAGELAFDMETSWCNWSEYSLMGFWYNGVYPDTWLWWGGVNAGHSGNNYAGVYSYPEYWGGVDDYFVSPRLTVETGDVFSFWASGGYSDGSLRDSMTVYVSSAKPVMGFELDAYGMRVDTGFVNTSMFTQIYTGLPSWDKWDAHEYDLSNYAGDAWLISHSEMNELTGWQLKMDDIAHPNVYQNPNPVLAAIRHFNFGVTPPDGAFDTLSIRNTGGADLVIESMSFVHGDYFEIDESLVFPLTVEPDSSFRFEVVYDPFEYGPAEDTLKYYSNYIAGDEDAYGGGTDMTVFHADSYNNPPNTFDILAPDDDIVIVVTETNMEENVPFVWTMSLDPDNDPVMYVISTTDENGVVSDTTMSSVGWFPGPTIGELAESSLEDEISVMTYSWNVWAHDSWDSTASSNGPWSLTIDVSGLLALDGIGLPDVFALHNNYPNPFNPVTNISYDIPEVAQVTLDIYNISGQKVRTLAQGQHEPGRYRIQWNATNDYGNPLSSGMYIYRIRAGDFVSVKKLILMK